MDKESSRDISFQNFTEAIGYQTKTNHLLTIAIDDYQHVAKLSNSVKDAEEFIELMVSQYQFESENVTRLFNADATLAGINKTFRQYMKSLNDQKDNLVVYFAGHGKEDQDLGEGYWVPVNAKFQAEVEYFPYQTLQKYINAIDTQHTVIIADSCYSGSILMNNRDFSLSERFEKYQSRLFLASGRNEVVDDGMAGDNSPFAKQLLSILKQNARSGDALRFGELKEIVIKAVSHNAKQTPIGGAMRNVGHQGGDFVFRVKTQEDVAWKDAQKIATINGYEYFLSIHPKGIYAKHAQANIYHIEEEEEWIGAHLIDTEEAYRSYLEAFPKGRYITHARHAIVKKLNRDIVVQNAISQIKDKEIEEVLTPPTLPKTPRKLVESIPETAQSSSSKFPRQNLFIVAGVTFLIVAGISFFRINQQADKAIEEIAKTHMEIGQEFMQKEAYALAANQFYKASQKHPENQEATKLFNDAKSLELSQVIDSLVKAKSFDEANARIDEMYAYPSEKVNIDHLIEKINQKINEAGNATELERKRYQADSLFIAGKYVEARKLYKEIQIEKPDSYIQNRIEMTAIGNILPQMVFVADSLGDFYMSKYEITIEQFCTFLNAKAIEGGNLKKWIRLDYTPIKKEDNKYSPKDGQDAKRPVTGISWYGAEAYAEWAYGQLPTERQWVYAAKGGKESKRYKYSPNQGVYYTGGGPQWAQVVGTKKENVLHLHDMSGNVWEWCQNKVIRGGSFNRGKGHSDINSSSNRQAISPTDHKSKGKSTNDLGFRIIRMTK